MIFTNSWKASTKSWEKHVVKVRIGKVTVFDFYLDTRKKLWGVMVLNFGVRKNLR